MLGKLSYIGCDRGGGVRKPKFWLSGALLIAAWSGNLWYYEDVKVEKP
jgi:hypothetical protein